VERVLIQGGNDLEFAMPIRLRTDFDAAVVRAAARQSKDGWQARRQANPLKELNLLRPNVSS
jgi:hypothetical protein